MLAIGFYNNLCCRVSRYVYIGFSRFLPRLRCMRHDTVSVCLSVHPLQAGVLPKQLINHANNTACWLRDSSFLMPDLSAILMGSPPTVAPNSCGTEKNCDFKNNSLHYGNGTRFYERWIESDMRYWTMTLPMTFSNPNNPESSLILNFESSFIFWRFSIDKIPTVVQLRAVPRR